MLKEGLRETCSAVISGALKTVLSTYKLVCSNSTNSIYSVFACYIKGHGMFGGLSF